MVVELPNMPPLSTTLCAAVYRNGVGQTDTKAPANSDPHYLLRRRMTLRFFAYSARS